MLNSKITSKQLTRTGIIGAIYATVTLLLFPISFGPVQVRVAEALTLLPLIFPEAIFGLTVGCLIANFFGNGILDIIFGTLSTLTAAVATYFIGKKVKSTPLKIALGGFFPVIINALVIPVTISAVVSSFELYIITALQIFLGQAVSIYLLGTPLYLSIVKLNKKKVL